MSLAMKYYEKFGRKSHLKLLSVSLPLSLQWSSQIWGWVKLDWWKIYFLLRYIFWPEFALFHERCSMSSVNECKRIKKTHTHTQTVIQTRPNLIIFLIKKSLTHHGKFLIKWWHHLYPPPTSVSSFYVIIDVAKHTNSSLVGRCVSG